MGSSVSKNGAGAMSNLRYVYHEAGHAVIAQATYSPVIRVVANDEDGYFCEHIRSDDADDDVVMLCAGEAAESHYAGEPFGEMQRWTKDRQDIEDAMARKGLRAGYDPAFGSELRRLRLESAALVVLNWAKIEAVASELHNRGSLTGDEVRDITIRTILQNRKTASVPVAKLQTSAARRIAEAATDIILAQRDRRLAMSGAAERPARWCMPGKYRAIAEHFRPSPNIDTPEPRRLYRVVAPGIAMIPLTGMLTKAGGFGTSTALAAKAIGAAVADKRVEGVFVLVDSPGGEVAGTAELAAALRVASLKKPTAAYIEDLGASAAYWVASQAAVVSSNELAEVGSIGVYAVIDDTSEAYRKAGVGVHVVASGPFKGDVVPGVPVADAALDHAQEQVDTIGEAFVADVAFGRGMRREAAAKLADGKTYIGKQARAVGLVDHVESMEDAILRLWEQTPISRRVGQN